MEKSKFELTKTQLKKILKELEAMTSEYQINISLDENRRPTLTGSKFGGIPYCKDIKDYPIGSTGKPLVLLAQINLSELPPNSKLPDHGLLQFFFSLEEAQDSTEDGAIETFGSNWMHPDLGKNYRVIYHEEIDNTVKPLRCVPTTLNLDSSKQGSPFYGEYAINFGNGVSSMDPADKQYASAFFQAAKNIGINLPSENYFKEMSFSELDSFYECIDSLPYIPDKSHLLGNPFFCQNDSRILPDLKKDYDTLLFQMASEKHGDKCLINFVDCGDASFFINSEDLKNRDFSKIFYRVEFY